MNYRRALVKIYKSIGSDNDIKSFWNEEMREVRRFFISNKEHDFFFQICQTSTNVYELDICSASKVHPYMIKISFNSLKELTERMKDYKDYFTHVSE